MLFENERDHIRVHEVAATAGTPSRRFESQLFSFTEKLAMHPARVAAALVDEPGRSLATIFMDLAADACNHDCVFCDGSLYPFDKARFTTERLLDLANEIAELGADSLIFAGEKSEPLLHSGFSDFADRLLEHGIRLGVYTNGSILHERIFSLLERFAFVRVSLNAATAATHQRIHRYPGPGNDFNRACRFLRRLAPAPHVSVGVSFLVLPENVGEIARAADLVRRLGAHYLELKPVYTGDHGFDAETFRALEPQLRAQISACGPPEGDGFQLVVNRQLRDVLEGCVPPAELTRLGAPRPCLTNRLRLVVSPRGCFLCPPFRGRLDRSLGDTRTTPLREIWFGARHRALMALPCGYRCYYHAQNEALLAVKCGQSLRAHGHAVQPGFL